MNRRKTLLTTSLLTLAFGVAPASLWILRHRLSQGKRPTAELSLTEAQVVSAAEKREESVELDKIFTKDDRLAYNGYVIEKSEDKAQGYWFATLKKGGKVAAKFEGGGESKDWTSFGLFPFLGGDAKQLLVEQYSGGAHCCYSYWIYDLGAMMPRLLFSNEKYGTGNQLSPVNIGGDGTFELTHSVMAFDYFQVSHASSVFPVAVFAYDQKTGDYRPANLRFSDYVLRGIEDDIKEVETLKAQKESDEDIHSEKLFSAVLQVTLKYIYAGRRDEGWAFFNQEYRTHNAISKEKMQAEIERTLREEPVYKYIYSQEPK